MEKSLYFSFVFLVMSTVLCSQVTSVNHTAINIIGDIEIYQDKAYVTNRGGLLIIDLVTQEEEMLVPANSDLNCAGTSEVEILSNGNMWISGYSDGGLYYYDGSSFEHFYDLDNGETIRGLNSLLATDDELWFVSSIISNGWYTDGILYGHKDGVFTNYSSEFPKGVSQLCFDNLDNIWVAYEGTLYQFNNGSFISQIMMPFFSVNQDRITEYYIDSKGVHWLAEYDGVSRMTILQKYENAQWTTYGSPSSIRKIFESPLGEIQLELSQSFGSIVGNQIRIDSTHHLYPEIPFLFSPPTVLKYDDADEVWLNTYNGDDNFQLYRIKDGEETGFAKNENFLLSSSYSITKDCSGNIYSNSFQEVQRYSDNTWYTYDIEYRSDCNIRSLTMNPYTCEIWGYYYSGSDCMSLWKVGWEEVVEIEILPDACSSISFDRLGNVYVVSRGDLIKISSVGISSVIDIPSVRWLSYVFVSSNDEMWVVGQDMAFANKLFRFKDGDWTSFSSLNSPLPENIQELIYEDSKGNIWMTNTEGLISYDGHDWTEYPMEFIEYGISDVKENSLGHFWMATNGGGVVYWDKTDFTYYTNQNVGLISDECYGLELVNDELWVQHLYGLTQMDISELSSTQAPPAALPEPQFTLYPNPSAGPFHVKNETVAERRYEVYDIEGRLVLSEKTDQEVWSGELEVGVYIVKVIEKDVQTAKKLFVSKM